MKRPKALEGRTYKIKPPTIEEAVYITINIHDGRPVEVFINSKHMESFQWVNTLTRFLAAVLQNPCEEFPAFAIQELKNSYDPRGGYFIPRSSVWVNGVVSHIGHIVEAYCIELGCLPGEQDD